VIWVSEDPRRLLVRGQVELPFIADVKIVLEDVKGPGDDFWAKHNQKKAAKKEQSSQKKKSQRGRRM
jgi:hypothetical protein